MPLYRNTWIKLNQHFPGHTISTEDIAEFIESCGACQKNRRKSSNDQITPIYRRLPMEHTRYIIGIDFLKVTPESKDGNVGLYVIRNLTTKHTDLYPTTANSAENAAICVYDYLTSFGFVECIISDPGSDFTSNLVKIVNKYLGLKHQLSIVDRHQSNGVERTNQEILKHLHDYVHDTRLISNWDNPVTMSTIRYFLNYLVSSETGISHSSTNLEIMFYSSLSLRNRNFNHFIQVLIKLFCIPTMMFWYSTLAKWIRKPFTWKTYIYFLVRQNKL